MFKSKKFLITSIFILVFCCGMVSLLLGSILPDLSETYKFSAAFGGTLLLIYSSGNLISGLSFGFISLKYGRKAAITLLSVLMSVAIFLFTVDVDSSLFLMCVCLLMGFGRGGAISFCSGFMNLLTDGNPVAQGVLQSMFAFGAVSSPLIFVCARNISGWRTGLLIMALIAVVPVILLLLSDFDHNAPEPEGKTAHDDKFGFFRERGFFAISFSMVFYLCCEYSINGWLVTYLENKNMPSDFAQSMAALLWFVMFIGRVICSVVSKFISQRMLMLILSFGSTICFAVMLIVSGMTPITLTVIFTGLFLSGISSVIYTLAAPYSNKYPMAIGFIFSIGTSGAMLMPFLTGVLSEFYGFNGGMAAILITFVMLDILSLMNYRRLSKIESAS